MATAIEQGQQLEAEIERLEGEIERAHVDAAEWELRQKEANSLLAALQGDYAEAAAEVVQGRRAPTEKLLKQIEDLREKLLGIGRVVSTKRLQLSDLQARLHPLHAEQSQREQARLIAEERVAVDQLIAETDSALEEANRAALRFASGLLSLRQRQFLSQANKHIAFDAAQGLQRRGNGMRA